MTGASGFIAGQVIKALYERHPSWKVKGSVRSVADPSKVQHLRTLFPHLELFEADLVKEGSFDEAFRGCDYVLHTASPFQLVVEDPQRDLLDPAVKGTLNVLRAAAKAESVKRVVLTSSVAAIVGEQIEGKVYTEDDWNLVSTIQDSPYRLSKRLAEETAWNFVKELNVEREHQGKPKLELVTICPSFVLGPPLSSRTDGESCRAMKGILSGAFKESGCRPLALGSVDVRDVALAHVVALEKPEAVGKRYILSSTTCYTLLDYANILRGDEQFRDFVDRLPDKINGDIGFRPLISHERAEKELGIVFTPIEKTIVDMAKQFIELGMVEK